MSDSAEELTTSNAFRLTGRQWMGVGVFAVALYVLTPVAWQRMEKLETGPDYRTPFELNSDYWLWSRVATQQNARVALDLMTRELRTASSISDISSCTSGVCTDLTFVDQDNQTIEYELSGSTLNRTCTATPATTTCDGTTLVLIGGVKSFGVTSYSVYDVSTATYTTTTTPAQVKVVKINVTAGAEQTVGSGMPGDQRATMESTVQLRLGLS